MGLSNRTILTCDVCGAMPLGGDKGVTIHHEPVQGPASADPEAPPPKKVDPEGSRFYRVTTANEELVVCDDCWLGDKLQRDFWRASKIVVVGAEVTP